MPKIKITGSVAGSNFSYSPGEIVEVEEAIARAWVEHGLGIYAPDVEIAAAEIAALRKQVETLTAERDGHAAAALDLTGKLAEAKAVASGAKAEMLVHKNVLAQAGTLVDDLKAQLAGGQAVHDDALRGANDLINSLKADIGALQAELARRELGLSPAGVPPSPPAGESAPA